MINRQLLEFAESIIGIPVLVGWDRDGFKVIAGCKVGEKTVHYEYPVKLSDLSTSNPVEVWELAFRRIAKPLKKELKRIGKKLETKESESEPTEVE